MTAVSPSLPAAARTAVATGDELGPQMLRHVTSNELAKLGRRIVETMAETLSAGRHDLGDGHYEIVRSSNTVLISRNGVTVHGGVHPSRVDQSALMAVAIDMTSYGIEQPVDRQNDVSFRR